MQIVNCPGCGAQIQFRSSASVLAVCEYCQSTILKDADSVKNLGKMSDVLEDYSPLQIGSSGSFGGAEFTVIGRIQLRYDQGMWNEWYVLFGNGSAAWLGDASGQYMITTEIKSGNPLPRFESLVPAHSYPINGQTYIAADIRTANCIGGQGELPFKVGQGWQARVADFRLGQQFLTLDYSDSDQPKIYTGQAVTLEGLHCQLLRDDDQVKTSAGKYKGKIDVLSCPSCGGSSHFLPGVTTTIICSSCHSQIDCSSSVAQVIAAGHSVEQVYTTLQLGQQATISGRQFQIIGLMKCVDNENTVWTEYLLHSPRAGFLWLIETEHDWARSSVLDEWPIWVQEDSAVLGKVAFQKLYRYPAKVIYAVGAFNWRVSVGDRTEVVEFQQGQNKLAAEINTAEITWSQSSPVSADQIQAWFGQQIKASKPIAEASLKSLSTAFIVIILVLNIIPIFLSEVNFLYVAAGIAAIYYPAKFLDSLDQDK